MSFSAGEIAGFIGAAAWVPQIVRWAYKLWSKPKIYVVADKVAEVGYSTLGSVLNLRIAVAADKKDVLLNDFQVVVTHEDGDTRTMMWQGTVETFSHIRDLEGDNKIIEKEQTGVAVRVTKETLVDRQFRFQDEIFHEAMKPLFSKVYDHEAYLSKSNESYHDFLLKSEQMHNLIAGLKSHFWWKSGRYSLSFKMNCLNDSIVNKKISMLLH